MSKIRLILFFVMTTVVVMSGLVVQPQYSQAQDATTATYSLVDGSFTFEHPAEWTAEDQGTRLAVTSNTGLLEIQSTPIGDEDVLLYIYGVTPEGQLGIESLGSAQEAMELLVSNLGSRAAFEPAAPLELGDRPAAWSHFSTSGIEGFFLVIEVAEDTLITVAANAVDMSAVEDTILDIIASMQFDAELAGSVPSRILLDPILGPEDAPITIYEFGSYGCEACRYTHLNGGDEIITGVLNNAEFGDQVRYIYVNFPVINPNNDLISAEVAQCVLDQGNEAFWAFHETMFAEVSDAEYATMRNAESYILYAESLRIDGDALRACMETRQHRGTVMYHYNRTTALGISATPTFFVNEMRVQNVLSLDTAVRQVVATLE